MKRYFVAISAAVALLVVQAMVLESLLLQPVNAQTTPPAPPRWVFERPPSQEAFNREYQEVGTLVIKAGEKYTLCWYNPVRTSTGAEETKLQIAHRRYRVEGGAMEVSEVLPFSKWVPKKDGLGTPVKYNYCATMNGVTRAGHWITEAQMCRIPYVSDAESCSAWMSSVQRYTPSGGGGTLDDVPRGWWIYAYIPAPTGVGT